jgi:lycopene beta-cyclase
LSKKLINIIGGGCAGLSLARFSSVLNKYNFNLFTGLKKENNKDHFWGFWRNSFLEDAYENADFTWFKWSIITNESYQLMTSKKHPYCAIKRKKWLAYCLKQAGAGKIKVFEGNVSEKNNQLLMTNKKIICGNYTFDSRPPKIPSNILLQHFEGCVVKSEKEVFDSDTVTLMDFRCDQSRGVHFLYLLPLSKKVALVESTLFSKKIENPEYYFDSIKSYLKTFYDLTEYSMTNFEKGIIPMHDLSTKSYDRHNIGSRGGAIRPSSGYAFVFIQKQIAQIKKNLMFNEPINTTVHKKFDLFMDKIFLNVINSNPKKVPDIFSNLAKAINGDEMAEFMTGDSKIITWVKIIKSMPKVIFIKSFFKVIIN